MTPVLGATVNEVRRHEQIALSVPIVTHRSLYGGSSEISGNPVPRSTRNRQVVERSWVYGQIEVVIWRVLSYTARERARGDKGFSLVSYLLGWLVRVTNQVR